MAAPELRKTAAGSDALTSRAAGDLLADVLWLKDLLLFGSTSGIASYEYGMLRLLLLADPRIGPAVPGLVRDCSTLQQLRAVVARTFPRRAARREFLMEQFQGLIALSNVWRQVGVIAAASILPPAWGRSHQD